MQEAWSVECGVCRQCSVWSVYIPAVCSVECAVRMQGALFSVECGVCGVQTLCIMKFAGSAVWSEQTL